MLFDSRERGREGERERNIDVKEEHQSGLLYAPQQGTEPTTQACALTGNRTCNLSVYGKMLQPTEPHQPGLVP